MKVIEKGKTLISKILAVVMTISLLVTYIPTVLAFAAEGSGSVAGLKVGASVRDITPTADMLPIHSGNARMGLRLVGVIEGLNLRVIALQNGGSPISLILSVETGKGP